MSHKILRAVRVATQRLLGSPRKPRKSAPEYLPEPLEARRLLSVSAATLIGQSLTIGATATYVTTSSSSSDTETDTYTVQAKTTAPAGQPATRVVDHRVYRSGATTTTSDGTEWYGLNTDGYVEFFKRWDVSSSIYKDQYTPSLVLVPATMSVGKSYRSAYADEWYYITPGISSATSNHTRTATLASETAQSVTVPAGTFKAYEVDVVDATVGGGASTTRSYYAPGVGFIKSVTGDATDRTTTVLTAATKIPKKLEFGLWPPSSGVSGVKLTPEIYVYVDDSDGNVVLSDISSVTLAVKSGPVGGELGGTVTVAAKGGVATFYDVNLNIPGTYTLEATDGSLTPAVSKSIKIISKASAAKLAFTVQPSNAVAGKTIAPVSVAIEYPGGGIVVNDTSTVTLAVASGPGKLGGTLTAKAVKGIATFTDLKLTVAGAYTLKATDGSLTPAVSQSFTIAPAAAIKLALSAIATPQTAGVTLASFHAKVHDAFGNLVTSNSSTVTVAIASGPAGGKLNGTFAQKAVRGYATFSGLSLKTAGVYKLKVTAGALAPATSGQFTISPAAAAKLVLSTIPTTAVAGTIFASFNAKVKDAFDNVVTGDSSKVTLAIATGPAGAKISGTLVHSAVKGIATFSNLKFTVAGVYTLKVTDGSLTQATSRQITITPAAAAKLVFSAMPTTAVAGAILPSFGVKVEDTFGNVVTADSSKVTLAIATGPAGAKITGTLAQKAVKGIATFSGLSLRTAGAYKLKATDGALVAATSGKLTVTPAAPAALRVASQPTTGTANATLVPAYVIDVVDGYGNIVTTDTSPVKLAIVSSPAGGDISGALTARAVKGVATFGALAFKKAGTYTVGFTDGSLTPRTSLPVVVH